MSFWIIRRLMLMFLSGNFLDKMSNILNLFLLFSLNKHLITWNIFNFYIFLLVITELYISYIIIKLISLFVSFGIWNILNTKSP